MEEAPLLTLPRTPPAWCSARDVERSLSSISPGYSSLMVNLTHMLRPQTIGIRPPRAMPVDEGACCVKCRGGTHAAGALRVPTDRSNSLRSIPPDICRQSANVAAQRPHARMMAARILQPRPGNACNRHCVVRLPAACDAAASRPAPVNLPGTKRVSALAHPDAAARGIDSS